MESSTKSWAHCMNGLYQQKVGPTQIVCAGQNNDYDDIVFSPMWKD